VDDLGYGDLIAMGRNPSKHHIFDRMAADGMRFTDFYWAVPALRHAAL